MKRLLTVLGLLALLLATGICVLLWIAHVPDPHDDFERDPFPRPEVGQTPTPSDAVARRTESRRGAAETLDVESPKQILFGEGPFRPRTRATTRATSPSSTSTS